MNKNGNNCNLCKSAKYIPHYGNICIGEKCRGRIIDNNDTICDEYEFGGFIELEERIKNLQQE